MALTGWGQIANRRETCRIELIDGGTLVVHRVGRVRTTQLLTISIEHLGLRVATRQATTQPAGYRIHYGMLETMLSGTFRPRALVPMPRSTREYTLLNLEALLPNGTRRTAVFSIPHLDESRLRDTVNEGLSRWSDAWVTTTLNEHALPHSDDLRSTYATVDAMRKRDILRSDQALAVRANATRPFISAIAQRLSASDVTRIDAERIDRQINDLQRRGRLLEGQAHELGARLAPLLAETHDDRSGDDRVQQIQALAELRHSGALTEDEFQAEKSRLLGHR